MNPTQIRFTQSPAEFALSTGYEVNLIDLGGSPVRPAQSVPKSLAVDDGGTSTVRLPIPGDLFEGIPSGTYRVGVRSVNDGGPSTWAYSPEVEIIGEPTAVTGVTLE